MQRLLPLRIETNALVHPVSLSVTMTRPPIATDGLWEGTFIRATARVSHVHQWPL